MRAGGKEMIVSLSPLYRLVLLLMIVLVQLPIALMAQKEQPKVLSVLEIDTYGQVLDALFPRNAVDETQVAFSFILRFRTDAEPESQIVIEQSTDGDAVIIEYQAKESIYGKLSHLLSEGKTEGVSEMVNNFQITKRTLNISKKKLRAWYSDFFDRIPLTTQKLQANGREFETQNGQETILLDGSIYEVWFKQRLNIIYFSLYDVDSTVVRAKPDFSLVKWMQDIRREIRK